MRDYSSSHIVRLSLMLFLISVAPLLYSTAVLLYAVNVPVGDDYALLASVNEFHALSTHSDKLQLLFAAHNEHRIAVSRAISLLVEWVFGSLDFRILQLIGNAALMVALYQLGRTLDFGDDLFKWALLFLLALQPQYEKATFYSLFVLTAPLCLLFAIMYLRCLFEKRHLIFLLLFYLLAVFSLGSGLFLVVIGAPVLAYQRQRAALLVHVLLSVVVVYFYFDGLTGRSSRLLGAALELPVQSVSFLLQLLGGIAAPPGAVAPYVPLAFGLLLAMYFVFHLTMTTREQPSATKATHIKQLIILLYCLMILLLIAVLRVDVYHKVFHINLTSAALDGRYRIYGIIFTVVALIGALDRFRSIESLGAKERTMILMCALAFNVGWFSISWGAMRVTAEQRVAAMHLYVDQHDPSLISFWAIQKNYVTRNLDLAISTDVYRP